MNGKNVKAGQSFVKVLAFTIPPRGKADLRFSIEVPSAPPQAIVELDYLVRELLPPDQQPKYDALKEMPQAGGLSILGLMIELSSGNQQIDDLGLSETAQKAIIQQVESVTEQTNSYAYDSHIDNSSGDDYAQGDISISVVELDVTQQSSPHKLALVAPSTTVTVTGEATTAPTQQPSHLFPTNIDATVKKRVQAVVANIRQTEQR